MSQAIQYPYIDLHSHLQFEDFEADRGDIIKEMKEKNVITINVGTTVETSLAGLHLALKYPDTCYATIGLHPVYAKEGNDENLKRFTEILDQYGLKSSDNAFLKKIIGIGECGMDFFRVENTVKNTVENSIEDKSIDILNAENQEKVFIHQIELAKKYKLPLMLHVRDSYQKTLDILSKNFTKDSIEYRGNAHFFVGSIEEAQAFLDLGFSISFTGVITFAPVYEELVRFVPLDRMFVETDSPYVAPAPYRGKRNNPVYVIEIYKKIAEIKGVSLDVVRETLYKNACKFWLHTPNK